MTTVCSFSMAADLAQRTLELVDIHSESRNEAVAVDYVRAVVPGAPVYDDDTVLFYSGRDARVLLAGHLDTVPAQENLPGRIEDGWVCGLGASDMKGGVAVMIELARAGAPFSYLFFGREELAASESPLPTFFERAQPHADLVVVLEPTDNTIQAGCLGNLNATLRFRGVSAHSARPWTGENAIEAAIEGLAPVVALQPEPVEVEGLEFVEVVTVTGITGGIASNVVPDLVSCTINYRYAPNRTPEEAEARLRELVGGELELGSNSPPARVAARAPLVQQLAEVGHFEIEPKQAWTPVADFTSRGFDAVNLGPGATRYAHRRDERVEIAALERCFDALLRFGSV
jgi:succinyl-diaminopimelate desuccinylase